MSTRSDSRSHQDSAAVSAISSSCPVGSNTTILCHAVEPASVRVTSRGPPDLTRQPLASWHQTNASTGRRRCGIPATHPRSAAAGATLERPSGQDLASFDSPMTCLSKCQFLDACEWHRYATDRKRVSLLGVDHLGCVAIRFLPLCGLARSLALEQVKRMGPAKGCRR